MQDYNINVSQIEELQMVNDTMALDRIFKDAKETLVNGAAVLLVRSQKNGDSQPFDQLNTLADLQQFKKSVYKYL